MPMARARLLGPLESSNSGAARLELLLEGFEDEDELEVVEELEELDVEEDSDTFDVGVAAEVVEGIVVDGALDVAEVDCGMGVTPAVEDALGAEEMLGAGAWVDVPGGVYVGVGVVEVGAGAHLPRGSEPTFTPPALT